MKETKTYNIEKMDGYEFEEFCASLLRKMGFIVEETELSGDNGIDLIAYSNEILFKGKYIVQCKRWEGTIGEPVVRDLYGVVLSNNANKGIIITNSSFTQQAKLFADGKNLELIDGNILNELIEKYMENDQTSSITSNQQSKIHFTKHKDFEINKYNYLKGIVNTNKTTYEAYLDYFNFLYSYIVKHNLEIMFSGLIEECQYIADEILKRFTSKGKKKHQVKNVFIALKGTLYMLSGQSSDALEILHTNQRMLFHGENNFVFNLVNHSLYFYPVHYTNKLVGYNHIEVYEEFVGDLDFISYKANLFALFVYIQDSSSSDWLYNQFIAYYKTINKRCKSENYGFDFNNIGVKINFRTALKQIEEVWKKKSSKLFIPTQIKWSDNSCCLQYSLDSCIDIKEIENYWVSDLNTEEQKTKNQLITSIHTTLI